jgi:hypothetical protein
VVENSDRSYGSRNINTLSESQVVIKALNHHQITTELVWDGHQSLTQLAEHNKYN